MSPSQPVMGGWFRTDPELVASLSSQGLPEPARPAGQDQGSGASSTPASDPSNNGWWRPLGAALAVVLLVGAALTIRARRRQSIPSHET